MAGSAGFEFLMKVGSGTTAAAIAATRVIQDLTYTGPSTFEANDIAIEYLDTGTAGSEVVTVTQTLSQKLISVSMDGGTSTATQIKAAIDASAAVTALGVTVAITGTGSNAQAAAAAAYLAGGYPESDSSFTTVGGLRSKSMSGTSEGVDITNHGSSEWRQLLSGRGLRSFSGSFSGVFVKGATLDYVKRLFFSNTNARFQLIQGDTGDILEGPFKLTSLEFSGEHQAEVTYSVSLESADQIHFLAAK